VALTVTSIVFTGGTTLAPMRAGLLSLRTLFREFFINDIRAILGLVRATVVFVFRQVRLMITDSTEALRQMSRFAAGVTELVTHSAESVRAFFVRSVRSLDDLQIYIDILLAGASCGIQSASLSNQSTGWGARTLELAAEGLFGPNAYAARQPCRSLGEITDVMREVVDTARYGDNSLAIAKKTLRRIGRLRRAGIDMSPGTARILADMDNAGAGDALNGMIAGVVRNLDSATESTRSFARAMGDQAGVYVDGQRVGPPGETVSNLDFFIQVLNKPGIPDADDVEGLRMYRSYMARMSGGDQGNMVGLMGESIARQCIETRTDCYGIVVDVPNVNKASVDITDRSPKPSNPEVDGPGVDFSHRGEGVGGSAPNQFTEVKVQNRKDVSTLTNFDQLESHLNAKVSKLWDATESKRLGKIIWLDEYEDSGAGLTYFLMGQSYRGRIDEATHELRDGVYSFLRGNEFPSDDAAIDSILTVVDGTGLMIPPFIN